MLTPQPCAANSAAVAYYFQEHMVQQAGENPHTKVGILVSTSGLGAVSPMASDTCQMLTLPLTGDWCPSNGLMISATAAATTHRRHTWKTTHTTTDNTTAADNAPAPSEYLGPPGPTTGTGESTNSQAQTHSAATALYWQKHPQRYNISDTTRKAMTTSHR